MEEGTVRERYRIAPRQLLFWYTEERRVGRFDKQTDQMPTWIWVCVRGGRNIHGQHVRVVSSVTAGNPGSTIEFSINKTSSMPALVDNSSFSTFNQESVGEDLPSAYLYLHLIVDHHPSSSSADFSPHLPSANLAPLPFEFR